MKRLSFITFSLLLGNLLLSGPLFAGVDYIKYHEEYLAQKNQPAGSHEGRHFQHKSKYFREENFDKNFLPTKERDVNQPEGKYDRPDWAK